MRVIGHRGAAGQAPENTLGAMRHALACGVDAVEIDVRLLDDALIVLHDDTLERTTSGHGHYKALTVPALRALDAGGGEPIPLLGEVIELVRGRSGLNVEVKEAGIAEQVIACIAEHTRDAADWRRQILLSSFDVATTASLARLRGEMALGILYEESFTAALARADALNARSLHLPLADVSAERVAAVHAHGLEALVYTVNDEAAIAHCRRAGVDGVFSDYPDRVIASNRAAARARQ